MSADGYMEKMRKLCEQYGHEWEDVGGDVVRCSDCRILGDVTPRKERETA